MLRTVAELYSHAYGETMRTLSKLALAALLIVFVTPTLAQGTGNTSITVKDDKTSKRSENGNTEHFRSALASSPLCLRD
jgi:hypothetical protein